MRADSEGAWVEQIFYVPGEHDVTGDDGKLYLERFGDHTQRQRLVQLRPQRRAFLGLE